MASKCWINIKLPWNNVAYDMDGSSTTYVCAAHKADPVESGRVESTLKTKNGAHTNLFKNNLHMNGSPTYGLPIERLALTRL
jgi:hypothetical protein